MQPHVVSVTQRRNQARQNGRILSYSQHSPGLTIPGFLRHARGQVRVYWQDGQDPVTYAGFGTAAEIFAWGTRRFLDIGQQAQALFHDAVFFDGGQPLSAPRLVGGFAFRDDFTPDYAWASFHPSHFILPHYQLVQVGDESWLTINTVLPRDESAQANLGMLQEAWQARYDLLAAEISDRPAQGWLMEHRPALQNLAYPMPYEVWETMLTNAIERIRHGGLRKVVLARVAEANFTQRVNVEAALAYLHKTYSGCYRFLFEPRPFHAFYGATPELLVQVEGQRLETMALAGSIRRGATPEEDAALAQELMQSTKNLHEQQLVVESIQRRLQRAVTTLHAPGPDLYRLHNIQHINTPIVALLREPEGVLPLVERLHPTPALGGTPRRAALEFLGDAEPVPRGWYGAPVGWIDHTLNGKFAVAIRSAVTQNNRVWMYAGAGIVADSIPTREWEETALKFRPMMEALGIEN